MPRSIASTKAVSTRQHAGSAIDRFRDELPTDAGDRLDRHVRERDPMGLDARYLASVASSHYASAFVKMLKDPMTGHLRFSEWNELNA